MRQKSGLHLAGSIAVEQHAQRQLEQGEGAEIGGGQQPQLRRREAHILHQVGRHDGIHRPQQIGHEVAAGEGQECGENDAEWCHDCNNFFVNMA